MVRAFSCAPSNRGAPGKFGEHPLQEARVALSQHLEQLLHFFGARQTSYVSHNSMVHTKA